MNFIVLERQEPQITDWILSGSFFRSLKLYFAVSYYTREAGVRTLERKLGALCRAVAVRVAEMNVDTTGGLTNKDCGQTKLPIFLDEAALQDILGVFLAFISVYTVLPSWCHSSIWALASLFEAFCVYVSSDCCFQLIKHTFSNFFKNESNTKGLSTSGLLNIIFFKAKWWILEPFC